MFHLRDGVTGTGLVRKVDALRDHAVEADHLEPLEPLLRQLGVLRDRREREALRESFELLAALGERALVDRLAVPEKDVEHDVACWGLRRKLSDARLGRVQTILHRVELELAVELDDDLAIERRVRRHEIAELAKLGEVAQQRPLVPTPERELAAVVLQHSAEAVPLRLVLPALSFGKLLDEQRFHRREGNVRTRHQVSPRPWRSAA